MLWIIIFIIAIVIESITVGLTSIWFALGAAIAILLELLGFSFGAQLFFFIIIIALCLILIKPITKRYVTDRSKEVSMIHRIINQKVKVTETIDSTVPSGAVYVEGKTWSAKSSIDNLVIPVDSFVIINGIQGVTLTVTPFEESIMEKGV